MGRIAAAVRQTLRSGGWPLVGLAAALLAGWLLSGTPRTRIERPLLSFPRFPSPDDRLRNLHRRTLTVRHAAPPPATAAADSALATARPAPARVDPMQLALSGAESAFVIEARALTETPVGQMLIRCLTHQGAQALRHLQRDFNFNPFEQINRIAIAAAADGVRPVLFVEGDFRALQSLDAGAPRRRSGQHGQLLVRGNETLGLWGDSLAIVGRSEDILRSLARLDAPETASQPSPLPEHEAYGEIYGTLRGSWLQRLLPQSLGERVSATLERAMVHVGASDDMLIVADAFGPTEASAELGVSLGAALALMRARAASEGDESLLHLLDESRVVPAPEGFKLEVALPLAMVEEQLSGCGDPLRSAP